MTVVLIRWYIKKGREEEFINFWENVMQVPDRSGLYRETLNKEISENQDPILHTFGVEGNFYTTFINVGMWECLEHFKKAIIEPYLKERLEIEGKFYEEIKDFEYKLRERIVLEKVSDRGGDLPAAKLKN